MKIGGMNPALSPLPNQDRSDATPEIAQPSVRDFPADAWPPVEPAPGRWRRTMARGGKDTLPAVTWEETPDLGARVRRGIHVPALVAVLLFVVALVTTAVFMLRALTGGHDEQAVGHAVGSLAPDDATTGDTTGAGQGGPGGERGPAGAAGGDVGVLYIHLVGEVEEPGVVELAAGSRVLDAIAAAGGATAAADLSTVNLARELSDGEQIVVYNAEEVASGTVPGSATTGAGDPSGAVGGSGVINVNTADAATLQQLSGVGPALAERIILWREEHGRFSSVDDLLSVSGIGAKKLAGFREQVGV